MIRFAGQALKQFPNLAKLLTKGVSADQLKVRLGMDAIGGLTAGAMTPGDLGDKVIAGLTDTAMSSVGGLAAGRLGGSNELLGTMLDMGGSMGGSLASMPVADSAIRMKDKLSGGMGETAWEKQGREQEALARAQMEKEILSKLLNRGGDPFLYENGLG